MLGFPMNVITLQIHHALCIFSAYAAKYFALITITMSTVTQESKVSSSTKTKQKKKTISIDLTFLTTWLCGAEGQKKQNKKNKDIKKLCTLKRNIQYGIGYFI